MVKDKKIRIFLPDALLSDVACLVGLSGASNITNSLDVLVIKALLVVVDNHRVWEQLQADRGHHSRQIGVVVGLSG